MSKKAVGKPGSEKSELIYDPKFRLASTIRIRHDWVMKFSSNDSQMMNDGLCDAENSLLLVVDIQQRLLSAMPEKSSSMMLDCIQVLMRSANFLGIPVIATEQYPKGLGHTDDHVKQAFPATAEVFEKTSFSCCAVNTLMAAIKDSGRTQIVIAGQEAHVCVLQTALQLKAAEFTVFVVEDAICSRKLDHQINAIQRMRYHAVDVVNHESVVFEWLRDASHPEFKLLSSLIR